MRSEFEPREHIMRAPVAAQDCDCPALLPKSLSRNGLAEKPSALGAARVEINCPAPPETGPERFPMIASRPTQNPYLAGAGKLSSEF
jgi:hypothetical protein